MVKLLRLTNPQWLGYIAPRINDFAKRASETGVTYETLYAYYAQHVQFGGENSEFWIAYKGELKPDNVVAWGHWLVRTLPHVGKVYFDGIHSWTKEKAPIVELIKKFTEFGKKHRATIYEFDAINERVAGIFERYGKELGYDMKRSGKIHILAKKI